MAINANYLDWYNIFVNEVSGSEPIFLILSLIVIMFICASLKFNNKITLTIFAVYILFVSVQILALLPILLIMVGLFFYPTLNKILSRE